MSAKRPRGLACGVFFLFFVPFAASLQAGKLGALEWEETLSASLEYNTNVNSSEKNPLDDWIFEANFGVAGSWDLTESQKLTYGFGIGYRRYAGNSGFNSRSGAGIHYVPDTSIDLAVRFSDQLNFKISDALSFSENATGIALSSTNSDLVETELISFERINNHFEIQGTWDLNRYNSLVGSVWRDDTFPLKSIFRDYRRTTEGVSGQWTHKFNRRTDLGLEGSLFRTRYRSGESNDSHGYRWGPFAQYRFSENFSVNGHVHFNRTWYEQPASPRDYSDNFEFHGVEWGVGAIHAFNRTMTYQVDYKVSNDYSYLANYRRLRTLSLIYSWQTTETLQSFFSASYEWGYDSGGRAPDDWEMLYLATGVSFPFWKSWECSSNIRWTNKNSHVLDRSFEQFVFYISLVYHFGDN